ncbi:glycosyltransferase family 4 protein [Aliivibrio logei]|uniref:Glycosyl transferase n=1 Tax=Aliivibrio logei TaxID=688 RepID=A0A1B9NZ29_ALILO|nr:glycosyltransferase family 4 protein [Aliivibrio logei]OCH21251.1 glycosyl transferase [Aliivibrio logei]
MSTKSKTTLLFVHYGDDWIRGSEICLINLIKSINHQKFECILWCNQQRLADEVNKQVSAVYVTPFTLLLGWKAPKFSLSNWYQLYQQGKEIVDAHQVDLIHCNSAAPCQWMNPVARHTHTPLSTHLHTQYPLRDRLTLGIHFSPSLITVSNAIGEELLHDGYNRKNLTVIPNGIDTTKLNAQRTTPLRQQLGIDSSAFVLATSGSLIHRKGVDLIIDSLHKLDAVMLNIHLIVIGEGEERAQLEQQANHLQLHNNIHFLGERDNVVGLLKSGMDAYISGARDEAFGLALIEASLAKLPVIAPMVGGIPEVISHYDTGFLTQPNDSESFAKAIMVFIQNPRLAKEMGVKGKEIVYRNFTLSEYAKQFEKHYEQQLSTSNKETYSRPLRAAITPIFSRLRYMSTLFFHHHIVSRFGVNETLSKETHHE